MLLILAESEDISCLKVSKWLSYFKENYIVITDKDSISDVHISLNNSTIEISFVLNERKINLSDINKYWYRRGKFTYDINKFISDDLNNEIIYYLQSDASILTEYILKQIENVKFPIGSFFDSHVNKLLMLKYANESGLSIPHSFVTESKDFIINTLKIENNEFITKVLYSPVDFKVNTHDDTYKFFSLTSLLIFNTLEVNECFFPSYIQQKVNKEYEVRVFFFDSLIWSMCIFSQANPKTSIDFRNYDRDLPNRCVPYKLPDTILSKIIKFISKSGLTTGSIDLIKTVDNEYVFLEVNPDGQFDFVSVDCNYYIEKKIAEFYAFS